MKEINGFKIFMVVSTIFIIFIGGFCIYGHSHVIGRQTEKDAGLIIESKIIPGDFFNWVTSVKTDTMHIMLYGSHDIEKNKRSNIVKGIDGMPSFLIVEGSKKHYRIIKENK